MNITLSTSNFDATLDDKWSVDDGRVMINGTQAIVRVLLAQKARDERQGLP